MGCPPARSDVHRSRREPRAVRLGDFGLPPAIDQPPVRGFQAIEPAVLRGDALLDADPQIGEDRIPRFIPRVEPEQLASPQPRHRQARLLQSDAQPAQLFLGPGQAVGHRPLGPTGILGNRLQMHGAQPGQIAQAKGFIDTLHDAFTSLPLLVIAGQIGMEPLCQVDVEPFRFDRLGRQPAARGRGYVRSARYTAAS